MGIGELKMEEMSLSALFEQARKVHSMATESTADQVISYSVTFVLFKIKIYRFCLMIRCMYVFFLGRLIVRIRLKKDANC